MVPSHSQEQGQEFNSIDKSREKPRTSLVMLK